MKDIRGVTLSKRNYPIREWKQVELGRVQVTRLELTNLMPRGTDVINTKVMEQQRHCTWTEEQSLKTWHICSITQNGEILKSGSPARQRWKSYSLETLSHATTVPNPDDTNVLSEQTSKFHKKVFSFFLFLFYHSFPSVYFTSPIIRRKLESSRVFLFLNIQFNSTWSMRLL